MLYIGFGESDYSIEEGSEVLSSPITLQFRNNQNPFTVMLSPVTLATAKEMGLGISLTPTLIVVSEPQQVHTLLLHTLDKIIRHSFPSFFMAHCPATISEG